MLSLGLKLLGIGKWLKEAFSALLALALRYPWQAALIALLCLSAWLLHGKNKAIEQRDAWHLAFDKQKEAFDLASEANRLAQIAQVKALEAKSAELAKEADNAHRIELADARRATDAYAAANRVRPYGDEIRGGSPSRPGEGSNPEGGDGAGQDPFMVAVKREDLDICTENTLRLQAVHDWGDSLIDAGIAEKVD